MNATRFSRIFGSLVAALVVTGSVTAQCGVADVYEPNGSCQSAMPILGGVFSTVVATTFDDDYYSIDVPAGATVFVGATSVGPEDYNLILYSGNCWPALAGDTGSWGYASFSWTNTGATSVPTTLRVRALSGHPPSCSI